MATLTSTTPAATYLSLLKVEGTNQVLDGDLRVIEDGNGNNSPLKLAITGSTIGASFVGNVGIGTDSPNALLEIAGGAKAVATAPHLRINNTINDDSWDDNDVFGGVEFYNTDVSYSGPIVTSYVRAMHLRAGTDHSSADAGLQFGVSTAPTDVTAMAAMTIITGGNVGIGCTPSEELHVKNSSSDHTTVIIDGGAASKVANLEFREAGAVKWDISSRNGLDNDKLIIRNDGSTAALTIDDSNDVTLTGDLIISTADKGISFTGGTDPDTAGSATGNILNDYEEGTWTATFTTDDVAPTTPRTISGDYTRIGNLVTITAGSSGINMTGGVGNLRITGIPFDLATADVANGSCYFMDFDIPDGAMNIICHMHNSDPDKIRFISTHDDANYQQIADNTSTAGRCYFTITYHCA